MRNAAMVLGLIAGIIGIFVGMFGWGAVTLSQMAAETSVGNAEVDQQIAGAVDGVFENPQLTKAASFFAPLLAIAGGAMAKSRALWAGIAMLISAGLFYAGFGFNAVTMFPIGFTALGGLLALAAGKPDEEKAHF